MTRKTPEDEVVLEIYVQPTNKLPVHGLRSWWSWGEFTIRARPVPPTTALVKRTSKINGTKR